MHIHVFMWPCFHFSWVQTLGRVEGDKIFKPFWRPANLSYEVTAQVAHYGFDLCIWKQLNKEVKKKTAGWICTGNVQRQANLLEAESTLVFPGIEV